MKNPDLSLGNEIKFYDDEVTLRFSERDHAYYLVLPDGNLELQDGVTQTCHILDKSMYLIPWACKMMEQKLLRITPHAADFVGDYTESILWDEFTELVRTAKAAHKEILVDASDVGAAAHSWLEDSIRWAITFNGGIVNELTEQVPNDERAVNCGHAALDWMKNHNARWLKTEHKIYSRVYKYAGTMDGLVITDSCPNVCCSAHKPFKNKICIADWKSSNALRTEYVLQTAAYEHAEREEFGTDIYARWILRLGKEDGKFEPWFEQDFKNDFEAFRLCLTLKRLYSIIEKRIAVSKKTQTAAKRAAKKGKNA